MPTHLTECVKLIAGIIDGMSSVLEGRPSTAAAVRPGSFKISLKKAVLRWHPDKFEAKFGARLCSEDKAEIMQRVHEIWNTLQREGHQCS